MLDMSVPTYFQYFNLGLLSMTLLLPLILQLAFVENALSWIWSMFATLQIITTFCLLKTVSTPNFIMAMQPVYFITGFQIPQYNKLIEEQVFRKPIEPNQLKETYPDLMYARQVFNIGRPESYITASFFFLPVIVVILLAMIVSKCNNSVRLPGVMERAFFFIDSSIRWNMVLRYFRQVYVPFLLSLFLI